MTVPKTIPFIALALSLAAVVVAAAQAPPGTAGTQSQPAPGAATTAQGTTQGTTPAPAAAAAPQGAPAQGGRGGRGAAAAPAFPSAYPTHAQADPQTIARGKDLYDQDCAHCHGVDARGGEGGNNLLRSELVMDDQTGELIAPVVQNGRPDAGMPKFDLTMPQITDISAYIHSFRVAGYDLSRNIPTNIVVGDPKAGEEFFNGAGKCATCHSVTGDLAGIGGKMDPKSLQNAIVSGRAGRGGFGAPAAPATARTTVTVTVTTPSGKTYEGRLVQIDDFLVTLIDSDGNRQTFDRKSADDPKVVVHNPLQAHIDMLPKFTDDQIHNLTAYLVTIK